MTGQDPMQLANIDVGNVEKIARSWCRDGYHGH